jgi:hypothetical protein
MTLSAGCLRLPDPATAGQVRARCAAAWILLPETEPLAVVVGSVESLTGLVDGTAGWLVPPMPVLQIGFRPENPAGYGRLVIGRYRAGTGIEAARLSRSLLPAVAGRDGFAATLVATDRATGDTFSLSLWATPADAASNQVDGWFADRVAEFNDCYVEPPRTVGAVLLPDDGTR